MKPLPVTKSPSDDDVDRALGVMEKFIRRFCARRRPTARELCGLPVAAGHERLISAAE